MLRETGPAGWPDSGASPELMARSVAMILSQERQGAATSVLMGALFGFIYVPAAGWGLYLAWYLPFAACMLGRQRYLQRLVARHGPAPDTLFHMAVVAAFTGWLAALSMPIFAPFLSLPEVAVITIIMVGWAAVAVSVLAVQPRVYAFYLAASFAMVYTGWIRHAGPTELLMIGISMLLGGRMMVKLGPAVWGQLRDTVAAAEENASLVSLLREALENQQEAHRARSRFLGAASHDLRQPVQALLFLSDIFRRSTDPGRRDAMAQQIMRTGESIDGMFRHLVDFAQIDAGTMQAVVQPVRLEQIVAGATSGFAEKCAARGLRFRLEADEACTVAADPVLLERMLRNFLDNAFKYSLAGEIVLSVRRAGDSCTVTVADQGVGMEPEDLAQACNAFFRGRSAALAEAEGIGLGLAICKHMADLMQAGLRLQSIPGSGTCASIRLALAQHASPAASAPPLEHGDAPLRGWLVAVLENDRLARDALCAWLEDAGAKVAQGATLAQLQEALRRRGEAPDCLVADDRLEDGSGLDAAAAVRAEFGPLPVLIVSGEPDIAGRAPGFPVLQKPVAPDRLLEALRAALPQWTGGEEDSMSRIVKPARASA